MAYQNQQWQGQANAQNYMVNGGKPAGAGTAQLNPMQQQIANSFNPGAFGGGYGQLGPAQPPVYGPGDPSNYLLQQFGQYFGPMLNQEQAAQQAQIDQILQQAGFTQQGFGLQEQAAQQNAGFSMQQLGIQSGQQDIQRGALQRQASLLPQQFGLENQRFDLSQAEAMQGADQARRGLDSSATARGAYTSIGANQGRQDITTQLQDSLAGIGIQRQQATLNFNESVAENNDSQKQLDLMAQQTGLSKQEVGARLQQTMAQLGLSNQISGSQFMQEIANIQSGQFSPLSSIVSSIMSQAGITIPSGG